MTPFHYENKGLTRYIKASGCAAKLDPSDLKQSLGNIIGSNARLLSSISSNEDAGVFALERGLNLVQTLDFITPVVDDPYIFGQIAAANSLSDVFAMGAKALTAMNIAGFDKCHFDSEILSEIFHGAKSKINECGAVLVGGHTIETPENIFGLSVTGIVGDNFWANNTAQVGDLLILTKPLGSGVLATCIKGGALSLEQIKEAADLMSMLNFYAVNALQNIKVSAATDVTGFGFLGHLSEMLRDEISFEIYVNSVPVSRTAKHFANSGIIPEGSYKNLAFCEKFCSKTPEILLCDAQTSGGLILSITEKDAFKALASLKSVGYEEAEIVGAVKSRGEFAINLL